MIVIETYYDFRKFIEENNIKHFKPEEFACNHCGELFIYPEVVILCEELRNYLQKPVIITSAYRCPEWNRKVSKVEKSAHTKGLAVDVKVESSFDRYEILNFLMKKGIKRIGIAKDFIHFDIDREKPQNVIWIY